MENLVATFTNNEDQMQSFVTKGQKGFHVSVKDLDSEMFLRTVIIYPFTMENAESVAIEKAKEIL